MADYERSPTKQKKDVHLDLTSQSRNLERSNDSDSYDHHGPSLRSSQEKRPLQGHSRTNRVMDRGRHSQSDDTSHRRRGYDKSEDRYSDSITKKHHRWISHGRSKTIHSHSHERDMSNGHRMTNPDTANERRGHYSPIDRQDTTVEKPHERNDRRDEADLRKLTHEKRRHRDNERFLHKTHYRYDKEEEQEYLESRRSPACAHSYSSDVTSLKAGHDKLDKDDLDEQTDQRRPTADHRSEHRHHRPSHHHHHSRGRPSSREYSSHSSSISEDSHDSRDMLTPKEGSSSRRRPSQRSWDRSRSRSQRRSPSHSGSHRQSESRHRGRSRSTSPGQNRSSVNKYRHSSSHSGKNSNKRKHRDRSGSRDGRKRRRGNEREGEREKRRERGRKGERDREGEKERRKKKDEERRSILTGKKIKLKVKKDKGDHERDANRKDLLQFLNSAFE